MKNNLLLIGATLPAVALGAQNGGSTSAMQSVEVNGRQYNIVYIFADQLRADVMGYAGDTNAITPNIDRLASQSISFSNTVAVSPVSAAYRASLLTGKYTSSTGMIINEINMNPNHRTIAHVLDDAGYKTAYIGKVHLNDRYERPYLKGPERLGFDDYWACYTFNHISYKGYYFTDTDNGNDRRVDLTGQYDSDVFTDLAEEYMAKKVAAGQKFAMFLSWNPPHDPWVESNVVPECYAKFADKHFDLPANFKSQPDPYMDRYPQEFFDGQQQWRSEWLEGEGYQQTMRCYYAMVNSIDQQVGRIMDCLDRLGISDNTILVFTSDHGEMFTSQGRMYKMIFYDEAARLPMLVRFPGGEGGRVSDVCINTPDIAPTLLGAVGLHSEIPEQMEGSDLSFVLTNTVGDEPEFAFMQGMGHTHLWRDGYEWRAVRDKRYTYARYLRDGKEVLLDRMVDPNMLNDYSEDPLHAAVMEVMRDRMAKKMEELNDQFMPCTWYRDHWMYNRFSIKAAAKGEFGPLPPLEPQRK